MPAQTSRPTRTPAIGRPPNRRGGDLARLLAAPALLVAAWLPSEAGAAPAGEETGRRAAVAAADRPAGVAPQGGQPDSPRRSTRQAQVGESGARPPQAPPETGVTIGERGIALISEDRSLKLRLTGRIHIDSNSVRADRSPIGIGESILIRRGRFEAYGNYRDTWETGFQLETASRIEPVLDAVLAYRGVKPFIVTAGNFREPFSLQHMSNSNQDTFVERAAVNALSPGRSVGVALAASGERWSTVVGGFLGNINRGVETGGQAVTARATYAPYLEKTDVLHFGIAGSYRDFDRNDRVPVLTPINVTDAIGAAFITTRPIVGARSLARLGLEAALQLGPVRLQGEYIRAEAERNLLPLGMGSLDGRSRSFDGAYVQASIPLNGPPRVYRIAPNYGTHFGIFGDMTLPDDKRLSRGGIGVFELAGRWSMLDLRDAPDGGGFERSWTVDLSWRPEPNVKIKLDHSRYEVRRPFANGGDVDVNLTEMRLQYYW